MSEVCKPPVVTCRSQKPNLMMPEPEKEPNPYQSPDGQESEAKEIAKVSQAALVGTIAAAVVSLVIVIILFLVAPGIGVLAALVLVPANLRAILVMRKEFQKSGDWPAGWELTSAFVISTLIMIPIWIASGVAFYAVCWAGAMIAVAIFPKADDYGFGNMILGGVPIGLIAGLVSFVLCFRLTLRMNSLPPDVEAGESKSIS